MAKASYLGDLLIGIQLRTKALEQGMNEVKRQLKQHGNDVRKTGAEYDKLAVVAGVAFYKIVGSIKSGVEAYNQFNNSMTGLRSTVQGTGQSFKDAQSFIDEFTKDGLVPANNAATALKNLLARGFSMDEATEIMSRFKDSAAFGRQAALTLGEAVQSATEGLKNENSILVDNAGVTKNVSQMWKEYAETIGKSVDDLTTAEKRQAEYNGILKETRFQVGDAAKYSREFSGAQASSTAQTLKLKQAIGGAMVPTLEALLNIFTPLITALTNFINKYPELTSAILFSFTAITGLITLFTSLKAAAALLGPALIALRAQFAALLINPYVLALTALVAVIAYVAIETSKAKKQQEEYNAAVERFNKIKAEGITREQAPQIKAEADNIEELIKKYDTLKSKIDAMRAQDLGSAGDVLDGGRMAAASEETGIAIDKLADEFQKAGLKFDMFSGNAEDARSKLADLKAAIQEAEKATLEELNTQAKAVAEKYSTAAATEALIKTYKNAQKGSREWYEAQQKLAEQFPQFSTASGILIDAIEGVTKAENKNIANEWENLQDKVKIAASEVRLELEKKKAKLAALQASQDAMLEDEAMSQAFLSRLTRITGEIATQRALIDGDTSALDALNALANSAVNDIKGVKPIDMGSYTSSYENKAMESALKVMEHKKRMDQLTLEDEVKTLETILKKHTKTADEKMEIEERIFAAKKEIIERNKQADEEYLDQLEESIKSRTEASFNWIDTKKTFGELSGTDEIAAYDRMIKYHKEYLAERMKDTKIEKDEKNKIYASEMQTIQDLERRKFEVRKSYVTQAVNDYITRKKEQYDWEEEQEREKLNEKLAALDKEYAAKERTIREEDRETELEGLQEQEKKYLNAATEEGKARLKQIQDDIKRLNRESEKDRMDEEKASRKEAIEQEISDNAKKYKDLKDGLETSQTEMLAAATEFAKESNNVLAETTSTLSDSLLGLFKTFDANNDSLMKTGLDKLRSFVNEYTRLLTQIQINPANLAGSNNNLSIAAAGAGTSNNFVVNDYGDKIINSKDEVIDYTQELFNTAKGLTRGRTQ